ncbi:MAG: hypothetical protein HY299_09050 [Verrucomicrobia bacterium]|nr:hypothetical protein [Verrucomicrobiota bacterium]
MNSKTPSDSSFPRSRFAFIGVYSRLKQLPLGWAEVLLFIGEAFVFGRIPICVQLSFFSKRTLPPLTRSGNRDMTPRPHQFRVIGNAVPPMVSEQLDSSGNHSFALNSWTRLNSNLQSASNAVRRKSIESRFKGSARKNAL